MTTIASLLFGEPAATGDTNSRLAERLNDERTLLGGLTVSGVALPSLQVADGITSLLQLPIGNIAARGWQHQREVDEARERTRSAPGAREVITLLEHRVTSRQSPVVQAVVAGEAIDLLELDLEVEIEATRVELVIERGEIVATRPGPARARATLRASGVPLASRELTAVDLRADDTPPPAANAS